VMIDLTDANSVQRSRLEIDKKIKYYSQADKFMKGLSQRVETKYLRPMVSQLIREVPKRRLYPKDYPLHFKTIKQQHYVMANLAGKPYQRKGDISRGWFYDVKYEDGQLKIKVTNKRKESKFVIGKIGLGKSTRSIKRYRKPLQPFHEVTGWRPAYVTIQKYLRKAKKYIQKETQDWIDSGL